MLHSTSSGDDGLAAVDASAFAQQLEREGIRYCQWRVDARSSSGDDVRRVPSLLVAPADWTASIEALSAAGCKPIERRARSYAPAEIGFLAWDAASGALREATLCTRTYMGGRPWPAWAPALESALLAATEHVDGVRVPRPAARLLLLVTERMLTGPASAAGATAALAGECRALYERTGRDDLLATLAAALPEIPLADFERALDAVVSTSTARERRRCARTFRRRLRKYRLQTPLARLASRLTSAPRRGSDAASRALTGGRVIALIGPQATGKSTLTGALARWLGGPLDVYSIHAGKPPPTPLTWLPDRLIPLVRRLLPGRTTIKVEQQVEQNPQAGFPLIFVLRKAMLAYERRALLRRAYRDSRRGQIVLSDRYPSDVIGAIDGATFDDAAIARESSPLRRTLMQWERRLYDEVCAPDLVLQLTVSVEKALERNRTRNKKGNQSSEYVRLRHAMALKPEFRHCPVVRISTDADFDETLLAVKKAVWPLL